MITQTHKITLVSVACCECGIVFGLEQRYHAALHRNKKTFYCPHGHPQRYGESEIEKELRLTKENEAWWKERAESTGRTLEAARRSLSATKGVLTRTKKRIANGVCPECHRQFTNLHRHMENKHPDYADEEAQNA